MGRPKLDIDADKVYELARLHCSIKEIAEFFGCSRDTIENRFREELDAGYAAMKQDLRRWQYNAAKKGNIAMLIFLGKQYLGQSDKQEVKDTSKKFTLAYPEPKKKEE
jgi:predicted transcriptional regulator